MNALNIRSAADFRAFLYVALPVLSTVAVQAGWTNQNEVGLWTALVLAVLGPVIAFINARSVSGFRAAFYAVLGAATALLIGYGLISQEQVDYWVPIVVSVLNLLIGGVAVANTDTTPAAANGLYPTGYSDTSRLGQRE